MSARTRSRAWTRWVELAVVVACSLLAGYLVLRGAKHAIGVSPDSGAYLNFAMAFRTGHGTVALNGDPILMWPPLYPVVVGAFGWALHQNLLDTARVLNALSIVAIVVVTAAWLQRRVASRVVRWATTLAVAIAPPLVADVAQWLWSESLFVALLVVAMYALDRVLEHGGRRWLLVATIAVALLPLTRYIGVTAIVAGAAALAWSTGSLRARLTRIVAFGAGSSAPICAWLLRNHFVCHSWTGPRGDLPKGMFAPTLDTALDGLAAWWAPLPEFAAPLSRTMFLGVALAIIAAILAFAHARKMVRGHEVVTPGLFALVYLLGLVLVTSRVRTDAIGSRLLVPIYVPALWVLALAVDRTRAFGRSLLALAARLAAFAVLLELLDREHTETRVALAKFHTNGGWFTGPEYDPVARFVATHLPSDAPLATNAPEFVYARERRAILFGPMPAQGDAFLPDGGYLLWLNEFASRTDGGRSIERRLTRLDACPEATLYRVTPSR